MMKCRSMVSGGVALLLSLALPAMAPRAEAVTIESRSTSHTFDGVRVVEGRTSGPNSDFHAAYVSLCSDYVHVDTSSYAGLRSAANYGSNAGAKLAINGDFFTLSGTAHIYGDAVSGGQRWSTARTGLASAYSSDWYYERYGWFAFGQDTVEFSNTEWVKNNHAQLGATQGWKPEQVTQQIPGRVTGLISGFPQLVVEGEPIRCSSSTASSCFPDRSDMRQRHPRTAMGLSRDRQTLILVVVDGRSSRSAGMYGDELADLMHKLGAHTAINLDGGGSSQMWVRGQGTINRPSDGSPRGVLNHLGVFAESGHGRGRSPGACDLSVEGVYHQFAGTLAASTTDVDGDGMADACIRTPDGVECHLSQGDGFGSARPVLGLGDNSGWGDLSNYATIRMGDVDGDGRADVCARANARVICWRYDGQRFEELARGPQWSDANGFDAPEYFTTFRLADVTGDGKDDLCIRTNNRFVCRPFNGAGFGAQIDGPTLSDDNKWDRPDRYGTIRMADINADGRQDLCARTAGGFRCWPSTGSGFGSAFEGPGWRDSSGWRAHRYWSTIRMGDLDGDGRADVCARNKNGVRCHLAEQGGFGGGFDGPGLSDDSGWDDPSNYMTMRLADITGDGKLDLCARANAGMRCWPYTDRGFGSAITGPLVDSSGWYRPRFYRTIQFADIDADGMADLCARASRGLVCWHSAGNRFTEPIILGPAWADDQDFDQPMYYSTLRLTGPIAPVAEPPGEDAGPTGDAGRADAADAPPGTDGGDTGEGGDTGAASNSDTGEDLGGDVLDAGDAGRSGGATATESCACGTLSGRHPGFGGLYVILLGLVGLIGRRFWRRNHSSPLLSRE